MQSANISGAGSRVDEFEVVESVDRGGARVSSQSQQNAEDEL